MASKRWIAAIFCLCAGSASAEEPLARIACPASWPGPDGRGAALLGVRPWQQWMFEYEDWEPPEGLARIEVDQLQMDCVYAGPTKDAKRRLTMAVPGKPVRCENKRVGKITSSYCEVRPTGGEVLGPVEWRMAETVTEKVTLNGFGLGMGMETLRALAEAEGYRITGEAASRRLALTGPKGPLEILLDETGLSREVILYGASTTEAEGKMFERRGVMRFGFDYYVETLRNVTPSSGYSKNTWYSDDRRIRVEFWPPTTLEEPASLHLIDGRNTTSR